LKARALDEIHYAFVRSNFKKADGRYAEHSFNMKPIWQKPQITLR
jgi:hypothetical protein